MDLLHWAKKVKLRKFLVGMNSIFIAHLYLQHANIAKNRAIKFNTYVHQSSMYNLPSAAHCKLGEPAGVRQA